MPDWFLAYTDANSEDRAAKALRESHRAHNPYLPVIRTARSHARKVEWVYRPFLPRYLLIEDDGRGVSLIRSCPGISCVIRVGADVARVSQSVVDRIRAREDDQGVVQLNDIVPEARPAQFSKGEALRVRDEHYWLGGVDVVFVRYLSGHQRVAALLNDRKIEIPSQYLERAA